MTTNPKANSITEAKAAEADSEKAIKSMQVEERADGFVVFITLVWRKDTPIPFHHALP